LRLLVPADALGALAAAAGAEATRAFGRALGEALGRRAASRLAAPASADAVIEHLGGEMALAGLGSLSLERWGRALVVVIDESPLAAAGDGLLEAVLAGAFEAASGKAVHIIFLAKQAARARFLMTGSAGVEKVRTWLAEGLSWGDALIRLHAGAGGLAKEPVKASDAGAEPQEAAAMEPTDTPRGDA